MSMIARIYFYWIQGLSKRVRTTGSIYGYQNKSVGSVNLCVIIWIVMVRCLCSPIHQLINLSIHPSVSVSIFVVFGCLYQPCVCFQMYLEKKSGSNPRTQRCHFFSHNVTHKQREGNTLSFTQHTNRERRIHSLFKSEMCTVNNRKLPHLHFKKIVVSMEVKLYCGQWGADVSQSYLAALWCLADEVCWI